MPLASPGWNEHKKHVLEWSKNQMARKPHWKLLPYVKRPLVRWLMEKTWAIDAPITRIE